MKKNGEKVIHPGKEDFFWFALFCAYESRKKNPTASMKWFEAAMRNSKIPEHINQKEKLKAPIYNKGEVCDYVLLNFSGIPKAQLEKGLNSVLQHLPNIGKTEIADFEYSFIDSILSKQQKLFLKMASKSFSTELIDILEEIFESTHLSFPAPFKFIPQAKGKQIVDIYQTVCENFPSNDLQSKRLLTGHIAAAVGLLDTSEKHDASNRAGNYNKYLVDNVRMHLKSNGMTG